ncbi:hypothetical protein BuS5_03632 [Desulfosarcina sp. BuS5]|nr:hypothetical protein BuS5_03632 [Desulfosarcina sp. BuS5]
MEVADMAKQMIDYQKSTFNNVFNAMNMLQEQSEKMTMAFLEQSPAIPKTGKKSVQEWSQAVKKGREDFKKVLDDNFSKMETLFSDAGPKA